ncbi:hypothetical protein RvY_00881 [Ramazzottius varieornatus]|uniref:Uncharacterized protein n=1 Tax=Ramazzottius varieornatus TaxID=947166 RepID=A0A1D1UEC0_RAMVA|nr:hypothetical protein RvY_00881 [Ramazzottius varieornatus]
MSCAYNVDFENHDMSLEFLRSKMEDMEPKVAGVGGKLQKVTEEVERLRELVTARRREIEDLESSISKRVNRTEDQVSTFVQEYSDHKTETLAVRQSLTHIGSEIACLKKWVMDNVQEITNRLDLQDQQFHGFKDDLLKRVERTVREATRSEMKELRYQVDAKFAAVKAAFKKSGKGDLEVSQLDEPLYEEKSDQIGITVRPVDDLSDSEFNSELYPTYQVDDGGFDQHYPYGEPTQLLEAPKASKKKDGRRNPEVL